MFKKIFIGLALTSVLIVGAIILFASNYFSVTPARSFDSTIWQTTTNYKVRYDMQSDLVSKHKLVGMTKTELVKLLGSPNKETSIFVSWNMGKNNDSGDTTFLDIYLKDGEVQEYKITERFESSKH